MGVWRWLSVLRPGNEGYRFLDRCRYSSFVPCCRLNFIEVQEESVISFLSSPPTLLSLAGQEKPQPSSSCCCCRPLHLSRSGIPGDGRKRHSEQGPRNKKF